MKPECKFYIVEEGAETQVCQLSQEQCMKLDICAIKKLLHTKGFEVMEITPIFKNIL